MKKLKGIIFINAFRVPRQSIEQANRLKCEFEKLNVDVQIIDNGFLQVGINENGLTCEIDCDFAVYLDKDKYLSEILINSGIRLFNSHDTIRLCDDKAQTYIALSKKGIAVPKTIFAPLCYKADAKIDINHLKEIENKLGYPIIIKESFGSMGVGVFKADNFNQLTEYSEKLKLKPHLFQEYIGEKFGTDVRVIVIGGKVVAAMERVNDSDFRSNIAAGGKGNRIDLPKEFIAIAQESAKAVNADYCGVDILFGKNGEPVICEVNSNAFFEGIEKVSGVNVAKLYCQYIIDKLTKKI